LACRAIIDCNGALAPVACAPFDRASADINPNIKLVTRMVPSFFGAVTNRAVAETNRMEGPIWDEATERVFSLGSLGPA
jgi:hypothetical protein